MSDAGDDKEGVPAGFDDSDSQDLQASTFQYGVVKTQQQLMMKNPRMNGDLFAEGTIDEEEVDDNHNGIPDDQEDLVGTFLKRALPADADMDVDDAVRMLGQIDRDDSKIDQIISPLDQDILNPGSRLHGAVEYVQQQAATDPQAQTLLDGYNNATTAVQSALNDSHQSASVGNFLALQVAELDRTIAKSDISKYNATAHGESKQAEDAQKWHDAAQSKRDKLAQILALPPDKQREAFDKLVQENPKSRIAREWEKFKADDLSKWDNEDNRHLSAESPDYATNNYYKTPGWENNVTASNPVSSSSSSSSWGLSSIFGNWAMPWSSSQPASASAKPATQAKADNSWSLSSLFGSLSMPWSTPATPTPAPAPAKPAAAQTPAADNKKQDSSWSLTSVFSNWSWPWSSSKAPATTPDPKQKPSAPATSGP